MRARFFKAARRGREARPPSRFVIGPVEISGIAHGLVQGLRSLHLDAQSRIGFPHPFTYDNEPNIWSLRVWRAVGLRRQRLGDENRLGRVLIVGLHRLWGWVVLARDIPKTDVYVFLFGRTFTNSRAELQLLRVLGKQIIFIYAGSDARPLYINCLTDAVSDPPRVKMLARQTRRQKKRLLRQETYATWCVSAMTTAHFLTRPYIDSLYFGLPRAIPASVSSRGDLTGRSAIRVLHSPSDANIKGTPLIMAAISRLQARGMPIELVTVRNQLNAVVQRELELCDFVVDQAFSDLPWSAFATEAAVFGKPAVVAGYAGDLYRQEVPSEDLPPSLYVLPADLEEAIERMAADRDFRQQMGREARRFAVDRWAPAVVAQRLLRICNGNVDAHWLRSPATTKYLQGCGHPEAHAQEQVRSLVERRGVKALQLSDKPALETRFLEFASLDRAADEELLP